MCGASPAEEGGGRTRRGRGRSDAEEEGGVSVSPPTSLAPDASEVTMRRERGRRGRRRVHRRCAGGEEGAAAGEARVQRLERLAAQPVRHALTYSPSRCERALFTAAEQCTAALSPIAPRLASCERARRRIVHGR